MSISGAQAFAKDGSSHLWTTHALDCILLRHLSLSTSVSYIADQGGILLTRLWGLGTQMPLERRGNTEACVDDTSTVSIRGPGFWHIDGKYLASTVKMREP